MMCSGLITFVILFFGFPTGLLIPVIFLYNFCCYLKLPFLNFEIQEGFAGQIATNMQKLIFISSNNCIKTAKERRQNCCL